MFRKYIDIGKTIAKRIDGLPVFRKEPKKTPGQWVVCPDLKVYPSKKLIGDELEYSASAYAGSHREASQMLDSLIRWGNSKIEARGLRFWLHAVKYSISHVKGRPLFRADVTYTFRVEEIKEEIL